LLRSAAARATVPCHGNDTDWGVASGQCRKQKPRPIKAQSIVPTSKDGGSCLDRIEASAGGAGLNWQARGPTRLAHRHHREARPTQARIGRHKALIRV